MSSFCCCRPCPKKATLNTGTTGNTRQKPRSATIVPHVVILSPSSRNFHPFPHLLVVVGAIRQARDGQDRDGSAGKLWKTKAKILAKVRKTLLSSSPHQGINWLRERKNRSKTSTCAPGNLQGSRHPDRNATSRSADNERVQ